MSGTTSCDQAVLEVLPMTVRKKGKHSCRANRAHNRASQAHFLLDHGVRHLVSLTERGPPHSDSCPGLTLHRLRIPDFCPPAPDQIDRFVQIVDEANARGEAVGVHCFLGFGRTGTMLACYLLKERKLAAGDAIAEIRRLRPGSIETYEQEKAVFQFYQRTK
ncbi:dual specificity protein phosphatase 23 [Camelus ferus]|nr:dual specificity protein phosphatase 23 [Camelus ferus]